MKRRRSWKGPLIAMGISAAFVLGATAKQHGEAERIHAHRAAVELSVWLQEKGALVSIGTIPMGRCVSVALPGKALDVYEQGAIGDGWLHDDQAPAVRDIYDGPKGSGPRAVVIQWGVGSGTLRLAYGGPIIPAPEQSTSVCHDAGSAKDPNFTVAFPAGFNPSGMHLLFAPPKH